MQRFVELVRRGTEADRDAALDCLRTALAPCALDAYPVSASVAAVAVVATLLSHLSLVFGHQIDVGAMYLIFVGDRWHAEKVWN